MTTQTQGGTYVPADGGRRSWLLGNLFTFKLLGDSEAVGLFELVTPPQGGAPPHLHPLQDEVHYVLEGRYAFRLDGRAFEAGPGSVVFVPKGTVHAFTNAGMGPGKILFVEAPAGPLERFLIEAGEPVEDPSRPPSGEPDMAKLLDAAKRSGGIEFVAPE